MNDEILRLKAVMLVQSADVSSLLEAIKVMESVVRKSHPELPDISAEFVNTDPAFAARLQQVIDRSCTKLPFDYE
jgi:hypothetical protein